MGTLNCLLAATQQAAEPAMSGTSKIMWLFSIITTILVTVIFLRQKKIAQNQVEMADLLKQLLEK